MVSIFPIFDNVDWYAVSVTFILVSTALLAFVEVWIATRKVEVLKDPNFIVGFVQGAFGYLVYHAAMHISWYVPFNPPYRDPPQSSLQPLYHNGCDKHLRGGGGRDHRQEGKAIHCWSAPPVHGRHLVLRTG